MFHTNTTKNQHYVSQAEQRLNAVNPKSRPRKQRIIQFEVTKSVAGNPELVNPKEVKIQNTLSDIDLFTLDLVDEKHRRNMESSFQEYESAIAQHSQSLLQKLQNGDSDVGAEVQGIFLAKFLNSFRSPCCVSRTLQILGSATRSLPIVPSMNRTFEDIKAGYRPHEDYICNKFDLSPKEYQDWISALSILLTRIPNHETNLLEEASRQLFANTASLILIDHFTDNTDENICLLSDRSFVNRSKGDGILMMSFNLTKHSIATLAFDDLSKYATQNIRPEIIEHVRKQKTEVRYVKGDLGMLATYNRLAALQCWRNVYAASTKPRLTTG